MQRVRFEKSTEDNKYRKGEYVSFDDETAERLIKEKLATRVAGPISVGNEMQPPREMRRIKFISPVTDSGRLLFSIGDIRFLPKVEADRFVDNGKAEEFAIQSVGKIADGDNKMVKPGTVRQKVSA